MISIPFSIVRVRTADTRVLTRAAIAMSGVWGSVIGCRRSPRRTLPTDARDACDVTCGTALLTALIRTGNTAPACGNRDGRPGDKITALSTRSVRTSRRAAARSVTTDRSSTRVTSGILYIADALRSVTSLGLTSSTISRVCRLRHAEIRTGATYITVYTDCRSIRRSRERDLDFQDFSRSNIESVNTRIRAASATGP